jgi:hypothetical protein
VRTPLVEEQIADQARVHGLPEERVLEDVILAPHAIKELIEPSEVAEVVGFPGGPCGAGVHRRAGDDGPGVDRAITARSSSGVCAVGRTGLYLPEIVLGPPVSTCEQSGRLD